MGVKVAFEFVAELLLKPAPNLDLCSVLCLVERDACEPLGGPNAIPFALSPNLGAGL